MRATIVAGLFGLLSTLLAIFLPPLISGPAVAPAETLTYYTTTFPLTMDLVDGLPDTDPTIKPKRYLTLLTVSNPTAFDARNFALEVKFVGEGSNAVGVTQRFSRGFYSQNGQFIPTFKSSMIAHYDRFPAGENQQVFFLSNDEFGVHGIATDSSRLKIVPQDETLFEQSMARANRLFWRGLFIGAALVAFLLAAISGTAWVWRKSKGISKNG